MFRGIYAGTSAMLVQEKMLDVVGNNLANVNSSGFRARVAVNKSFPEVLMDRIERYPVTEEYNYPPSKFHPGSRVTIGSMSLANVLHETYMSKEQGGLIVTERPFDAALGEDGFFVVQDGAGNTFYTRCGQFQKSGTGQLVTHDGMSVQGAGGAIEIGDAEQFAYDSVGNVVVNNEVVGQLQVVRFDNPTYLHQVGKSLLQQTAESGAPAAVENPVVVPGALEMSNVNVVSEMVRMIEANRAYEAAGKTVSIQDETAGRLITAFGRSS